MVLPQRALMVETAFCNVKVCIGELSKDGNRAQRLPGPLGGLSATRELVRAFANCSCLVGYPPMRRPHEDSCRDPPAGGDSQGPRLPRPAFQAPVDCPHPFAYALQANQPMSNIELTRKFPRDTRVSGAVRQDLVGGRMSARLCDSRFFPANLKK